MRPEGTYDSGGEGKVCVCVVGGGGGGHTGGAFDGLHVHLLSGLEADVGVGTAAVGLDDEAVRLAGEADRVVVGQRSVTVHPQLPVYLRLD